MKSFRFFSILFLLLTVVQIQAQTSSDTTEKWVRIETEKNKLSFAVPPDFLVDAEKRSFGQKLRLLVFQKDFEIQIAHHKNSGGYFSTVQPPNAFKVGDFTVHKFDGSPTEPRFSTTVLITDKTNRYAFRVAAENGEKPEIARFLYSIRIENKPLFVNENPQNLPEKTISIAELGTSPEIIEAFERKIDKSSIKVNFSPIIEKMESDETADLTRPVIILDQPAPGFSPPTFTTGTFKSSFKVQFLANGQIGEITVKSSTSKDFATSCIESIKKIRFLPAQKDGKNVDAFQTVDYMMQFMGPPNIIRR